MADKKTPAAPKAKKSKTAAQKAKAEANIKAAQMRLVALQAKQKAANEARKNGIFGSDDTVLRIIGEQNAAKERKEEDRKAREFVENTLSGPHGDRVRKFMGKGLKGEPTKVALVVRNFLNTQGLKEAV
jgi:hypothetical protein